MKEIAVLNFKRAKTVGWIVLAAAAIYWAIVLHPAVEPLGPPPAKAVGFAQVTTDRLFLPKSGTAWYVRLIAVSDLRIWDQDGQKMSSTTTWANSALAMTDATATLGGWTVVLPADLPPDRYYAMFCDQAGASAASTDWDDGNPIVVIRWIGGAIAEISQF